MKENDLKFLFLIYYLIILGSVFSFGFFNFGGYILLLITLLIFIAYWLKITFLYKNIIIFIETINLRVFIWFVFFQSIFFTNILISTIYNYNYSLRSNLLFWITGFTIFISFLPIFYHKKPTDKIYDRLFCLLIILAILTKFICIAIEKNPRIDVFDILTYGTQALFRGENPYQIIYPQLYKGVIPDYFSYLPGALLAFIPSILLFNDTRFTLLFYELIFIFLLRRLISGNNKQDTFNLKFFLPLIFYYHPLGFQIYTKSYFEIVMILLIFLFAKLYLRKNNILWLLLIVSLTFYFKQHLLVLALFYVKLIGIKKTVTALFLTTLGILPFFLWSIKDFLSDVFIGTSASHAGSYFLNPTRYDGLTLNPFFHSIFHINFPIELMIIFWVSFLIIILTRMQNTILSFLYGITLFFFGFFVINNLAFANYYYFINGLIVVLISFYYLNINELKFKVQR